MLSEEPIIESASGRKPELTPGIRISGMTRLAVKSLPDYVPRQLKEQLISDHPDPDIRFISKILPEGEGRDIVVPPFVKKEERKFYEVGIWCLNEISTQGLAIEALQGRVNLSKSAKIIPSDPDVLINWFTGERAFPLNDTNVGLLQHLHIAYLSGKRAELDEYLQENFGISGLDRLAVIFGKAVFDFAGGPQKKTKTVVNNDDTVAGLMSRLEPGRLYVSLERIRNQAILALETIAMATMTALAAKEYAYPHNTETFAMLTGITVLSALGTAFLGYHSRTIGATFNSTVGVGMHEIVHYLSTDFDKKRTGLINYN